MPKGLNSELLEFFLGEILGMLDFLPWNKKRGDFLSDVGSSSLPNQDPMATSEQGFSNSAAPSGYQDPMASMPDPLANRDPLSNQGVLASQDSMQSRAMSQVSTMQDPFAFDNGQTQPQTSSFQDTYSTSSQSDYSHPPSRDVELILAKLDAIKAELDSLHQRVRKIEQSTDSSHAQKYKW